MRTHHASRYQTTFAAIAYLPRRVTTWSGTSLGYVRNDPVNLIDPTGATFGGSPAAGSFGFGTTSFSALSVQDEFDQDDMDQEMAIEAAMEAAFRAEHPGAVRGLRNDKQSKPGNDRSAQSYLAAGGGIVIGTLDLAPLIAAAKWLFWLSFVGAVGGALYWVWQHSGEPARSIDDPSSLEGATPEEVEEAAKEAGFTERGDPPSNDPNGVRLRKPGNPADQVRIQGGNPADPDPVKQGPYVRVSEGGVRSDPIPLAGNPTLP